MSRTIKLTYTYPHPIGDVWRALTTKEALATWFMENDFEPRVGHAFEFRTDPAPGFDGIVRCKVLEIDEPQLIRFTWVGGPVDTVVSWALDEVERGTRLRVTQSGFEGFRASLVSLLLKSGGKKLYGKTLATWLADRNGLPAGAPRCWRPQTRLFERLATLFARRDPKQEQGEQK